MEEDLRITGIGTGENEGQYRVSDGSVCKKGKKVSHITLKVGDSVKAYKGYIFEVNGDRGYEKQDTGNKKFFPKKNNKLECIKVISNFYSSKPNSTINNIIEDSKKLYDVFFKDEDSSSTLVESNSKPSGSFNSGFNQQAQIQRSNTDVDF